LPVIFRDELSLPPLSNELKVGDGAHAFAGLPPVNARLRVIAPLSAAFFLFFAFASHAFAVSDSAAARAVSALNLLGEKQQPFADRNARAFVFVFLRTDCPISNAYAPELKRLHDRCAGRAVSFWLVYIDRDEKVAALRDHMQQFRLRVPALSDTEHSLVQFCAPERTPEAVVFAADFRKVYSGRIDDRFTAYGKQKASATKHDLAEAIEATLENRPVAESRVAAVGCPIADLR